MNIYAISDLHLSFTAAKPMDIFGEVWEDHFEEIKKDWNNKVGDDDIVLLPGDFSWAMTLAEAKADFAYLEELKGIKIILRGNHDYWWSSLAKVKEVLPKNTYAIQNNALKFGNIIICGTKGWTVQETGKPYTDDDKKLFQRETLRLELSLTEAKKLQEEGDRLIIIFHYPPFNNNTEDSAFTKMVEDVGATAVVYGHLHGKHPFFKLQIVKNGIPYYLTSCDVVKNKLVKIL